MLGSEDGDPYCEGMTKPTNIYATATAKSDPNCISKIFNNSHKLMQRFAAVAASKEPGAAEDGAEENEDPQPGPLSQASYRAEVAAAQKRQKKWGQAAFRLDFISSLGTECKKLLSNEGGRSSTGDTADTETNRPSDDDRQCAPPLPVPSSPALD